MVSGRQNKKGNENFQLLLLTAGIQLVLPVSPCVQLPRFYGPSRQVCEAYDTSKELSKYFQSAKE
jgi:hypothetical protein